ncbi:MAG: hypothetical protein QY332_05890 [Anaerolineales bacterium]|nr:MAG: hypothetical protein QY332_05890 [Anaerolineales bacterium]
MNAMRHDLHIAMGWGLILLLLTLTACGDMTVTPVAAGDEFLLPLSTQMGEPCQACAQATLAAALTQQKSSADNQAAATAEIMRANAQATVQSADATLSAAQTQSQNNANVIAAQIAGTAAIVRANAQATIHSAGSTQNAALIQDSIQQTQMADLATTSAEAVAIQQFRDDLAADTQTAVANHIATQTQSAVATSYWYTDQERQREEQRQGPIAFLWMWCLPIFLVLLAGLIIWGFWRWLKIQQANQQILDEPVEKVQASVTVIPPHIHTTTPPYLESDVLEGGYQVTTPDDQVHQWLDEVKDELQRSDEKDTDDAADN